MGILSFTSPDFVDRLLGSRRIHETTPTAASDRIKARGEILLLNETTKVNVARTQIKN